MFSRTKSVASIHPSLSRLRIRPNLTVPNSFSSRSGFSRWNAWDFPHVRHLCPAPIINAQSLGFSSTIVFRIDMSHFAFVGFRGCVSMAMLIIKAAVITMAM